MSNMFVTCSTMLLPSFLALTNFGIGYAYLEELLQNVPGTHQVFERWMQWEPDDKVWQAYIKMEECYNELDRVNIIYECWIAIHLEPRVWVKPNLRRNRASMTRLTGCSRPHCNSWAMRRSKLRKRRPSSMHSPKWRSAQKITIVLV